MNLLHTCTARPIQRRIIGFALTASCLLVGCTDSVVVMDCTLRNDLIEFHEYLRLDPPARQATDASGRTGELVVEEAFYRIAFPADGDSVTYLINRYDGDGVRTIADTRVPMNCQRAVERRF